ncbi:LacI family DNA-binding transcriptional regulator [Actinopolymorpha rutila]|uniref:LacI family transcriptional regulator n=1 Tax=Actinopolymorpha rutila TaxID=446787 RepID=A0A852Z619_9ACTN|nr:LacI family DNA-binding transcriptional regulator [Actinopolymorpha rutila]NYH88331.1 LacI family transcriptional regulator [Actinopolymorpha rutila]
MPQPLSPEVRAVTIRDVASLAGVSVGTASKALNGRGKLRQETRDRVVEAARQLGFRPNALARGLLSGRTFTVGLVTSDSFGRFSIPVMLGAEDALGAGQISVFMCDTRDDPIRERHHVQTLLARRVDGLLVTGRRTEPRPSIGADLPVPVVYAMTQSTDPADLSVIPDDEGGGALAVGHLLATGRTRIAHIAGPSRFLAARQRAAGVHRALAEVGLPLAGGEPLYGEWTEEWGRQGADILLRAEPEVDAIFCGNDQIARGVAETLRERGRRVPGDIALIGFDNWEAMALGSRPPLTTVDMSLGEVGRIAAEHLLAAIGGRPVTGGMQTIPCRLVVRESTGPRREA